MSWNTIAQLIRILGYSLGAGLFGEATADGELFQQALGGAVSLAAFVWWVAKERSKT